MTKPSLSFLLSRISLFSAVRPEHIERIAEHSQFLSLAKGVTIFSRGDAVEGFYYLISGSVKIFAVSRDGAEKVIHLVSPGESFGEAAMFLDVPAPVGTQVMQDSHILLIPRWHLFSMMEQEPKVAQMMMAGLSMRMHRLIQDIQGLSLLSGTERFIGYLLQLCTEQPGVKSIVLPAAKNTIASLLNLTPETLSRIMSRLEQAGLIVVKNKEIGIPDIDRLRGQDLT